MNQPVSQNRRWVLASRPQGAPVAENFRLETQPVPAPAERQLLLRTVWLSLDPYMRGRMSDAPSYSPPVEIGAVMVGERSAGLSSQTIPISNRVSGCWATAAGRSMNFQTVAAW